jgi:hypothetical protein
MAETKNTQQGDSRTTRRGFIGAIGAAAAATALPSPAAATPLTWPETLAAWPGAFRELVERFRPLYAAEVARLAETLRPRFESGELHAMTDEELEDGQAGATAPMWRIEAAAGEHFGLVEAGDGDRQDRICEGAEHVAAMILAVSPSSPFVDAEGWHHPAFAATECVLWDVIFHARERGWYTPGPTEQLGRTLEECEALEAARAAGARS